MTFDEFFEANKLETLIYEKLEELNKQLLNEFGIYVTDIGLNRKNFPFDNIDSIENKMSKQIEKESEKLIAEGNSAYDKAKAKTDRQRKELLAEAVEHVITSYSIHYTKLYENGSSSPHETVELPSLANS